MSLSSLFKKGRWLVCALPPAAFIVWQETPGLSGLNGINAAGLIVLSPLFLAAGFGLTAAIALIARWLCQRWQIRSRVGFAVLMLILVGLLSPLAYLDQDWLLLDVIELASVPAALLLGPARPFEAPQQLA